MRYIVGIISKIFLVNELSWKSRHKSLNTLKIISIPFFIPNNSDLKSSLIISILASCFLSISLKIFFLLKYFPE